jgi:hypothetical protein
MWARVASIWQLAGSKRRVYQRPDDRPLDRCLRERQERYRQRPDTGSGTPPIVDMGAYEVEETIIYLPLVRR